MTLDVRVRSVLRAWLRSAGLFGLSWSSGLVIAAWVMRLVNLLNPTGYRCQETA
jgi:hypothetical protein